MHVALVAAAHDEEHLAALRAMEFRSAMVVPLKTRDRVLGIIVFVNTESGRRHTPEDLAFAEDLAGRAALAVENARLYRAEQQTRKAAEQTFDRLARLQAISSALSQALTPQQVADLQAGLFYINATESWSLYYLTERVSNAVGWGGAANAFVDSLAAWNTVRETPRALISRTVAVPAFQNDALRYKVESRFTDAVMRELVHRGRGLRVQGDREGADAVIEGVIKSFNFGGVLLDDKGRARIFEVTIGAAVTVRDQTENRVLYDNQNFVFRGEYEFASDPRSFFNEEDPAILRMSRSFAESIVSTLINAVQIEKK